MKNETQCPATLATVATLISNQVNLENQSATAPQPIKVLKVNCDAELSQWLAKRHPELDQKSVESDLPISGNEGRIDIVLVGAIDSDAIELAKAISDWPSAPPAIFFRAASELPAFRDQLDYTPGIGRNILACGPGEENFLTALEHALQICEKRRAFGIGLNSGLILTNPNVSPAWLFQLMLKELPEYIYFKDTKGRFLALSEYNATRSGLSDAGQAIGLTDYELFDQAHSDEAAADEAKLVSGEVKRIEKEEFVTWKDNEIWVHSIKLPMLSPSGLPLGTFGISRDITAEKRLSKQLERQHKELADELNLARSLQQSLLTKGQPKFRNADGARPFDLSTKHIPSSQLSGDFYSILRTPSGKVAIFLADVMGHGASAAMVTAMLYAAVSEINHLSDSPSAFMQEINNRLFHWLGEKGHMIFATGIFCVIDTISHRGEFCLCGGTHVLLPNASGDTTLPINPALGLIPNCSFTSQGYPIEHEQAIVFFTDGVLEATDADGKAFGLEGIARSVAGSRNSTAAQKLQHLTDNLVAFSGKKHQDDDICLIAFEFVSPQ